LPTLNWFELSYGIAFVGKAMMINVEQHSREYRRKSAPDDQVVSQFPETVAGPAQWLNAVT
jgi:hypothetical protein